MKRFKRKRIILSLCAVLLATLVYLIVTSFIFSANLGYLSGGVLNDIDIPDDDTYVSTFDEEQVNWEMAYWSAMLCEYTYEKQSYPLKNLAFTKLGFSTSRVYSFYDLNGEHEDDLMVDVGIKEIVSDDGTNLTLVAVAFRGSVPVALNDPTSKENMRRNMKYSQSQWKEVEASVHGGFYDQYCDFLTDILPEINATLNLSILTESSTFDSNIRFWVTGHSMGGALAELFTLDLVESGLDPKHIITYGFSTPLVGDKRLLDYAEGIGASDRIYKVVHKQDMVGFIGYGLLLGKSIASDDNCVYFGNSGIFDRSHHSLPRIYLPFIASMNNPSRRQQYEASLVVLDM